jgi:uncharacterized damage-inducible protein DinB
VAGVHPLVMPVFFSFAQVREDLARHTVGLNDEQVWRVVGTNSLGFQLKHIAGSVDRITTYLQGKELSKEQLATLRQETLPTMELAELLGLVDDELAASEAVLRTIKPETIYEARAVGRRALPTTVLGLLVHLAEHTQRHLGQAITIATVVRQTE